MQRPRPEASPMPIALVSFDDSDMISNVLGQSSEVSLRRVGAWEGCSCSGTQIGYLGTGDVPPLIRVIPEYDRVPTANRRYRDERRDR